MKKRWGRKIIACLTAAAMIGTVFPQSADFIRGGGKKSIVKAEAEEMITLTDAQAESIYADNFAANDEHTMGRVSVHDPSIVVGYEAKDGKIYPEDAAGRTKVYYIFGSHRAWAYSYDLINWKTFTNNINTDEYTNIFKNGFDWSKRGDSVYNPEGNMWAPDVFWDDNYENKDGTKGAWLMYMSINGCSWNSVIVLLTSDTLNGDWTYQDEVVYSGFANDNVRSYLDTDYQEVTGEDALDSRYYMTAYTEKDDKTNCTATTWNKRYGAHAIDPCVFYDEDGKLWMSYGSWSGGIWMFQLDETTGLRDYGVKYEYEEGVTDPYMGYKLAGGSSRSGEASYIEYIDGKYYLFVTYGGLSANGGYNMRVFSSENVTGPYVDLSGEDARYPQSGNAGTNEKTVGTRPMSYYRWNHMNVGFAAQGHNSDFVDTDGKAYLIYHTRFDNGTEEHQVRVHQLFTGEHGELVAAPFEYSGETLKEGGYGKSEVTGTYQILYHTSSINYANLECVKEQTITLKEDGTVTGDYTGNWEMKEGKPYVTLTTGNVDYSGVFVEQELEETDIKTMCFTLAGTNDVTIWGYRIPEDDMVVAVNAGRLSVSSATYGDINLPAKEDLLWGADIIWESSNPAVLSNDGVVTTPTVDTEVMMTATISKGNYQYQKTLKVLVKGDVSNDYDPDVGGYLVGSYYENDPQSLAGHASGDLSFANPFHESVINGVDTKNGVIVQFDVSDVGAMSVLGTILGFGGISGKLYFTQGSYLGYNATGGYFDANLKNYLLVKDYIGTGGTVRIKLMPNGFTVWVNDNLAYTESIIDEGNGAKDLKNYGDVLTWLNKTAEKVYLGYGGWWADPANCSISNIKFYVCGQKNTGTGVDPNQPETENQEVAKSAGVIYGQNYEDAATALSGWNSTNASDNIITGTGEEYGTYLDFSPKYGNASRGAELNLDLDASDLTKDYIVETDVYLDGRSGGSQPNAQFAITTNGYSYDLDTHNKENMNNGLASGYILKLSTNNSTTWKVNDSDTDTVTIPVKWVHIKAEVKPEENKAHIIITEGVEGNANKLLYDKDVDVNGSATVSGLYILAGRSYGVNHVDNTYIYRTEMTKSDDNLSFAVNRVSYPRNDYISDYYDNPLYGKEISELSMQYTINWMNGAAKNGWDGIFSFYNETSRGRVSVQTNPFIAYNNEAGRWLNWNKPDVAGSTQSAPSLQTGKDHIVKIKITDNNITVSVNGSNIAISEESGNGEKKSELLDYISQCDKFTLGVGLAKTAYWNTELCSISDLVISAQPTANSVYIANDGQNAYGSVLKARVTTSSDQQPSYQWYESAEEAGSYTEISDATSVTYIPKAEDIGKYLKVKAVIEGDSVESTPVLITKRALAANVTVKDKVYDKTADAQATVDFSGMATGDDITYTATAKFDDANAGSSKNVTVTLSLDEKWKNCYELKETSFKKTAEIFKAVPDYEKPEGLTAETGKTLRDVALPAGFSFQDPLDTVLSEAKDYTWKVTYTPDDIINYEIVKDIEVIVKVSDHVHEWAEKTTKPPTCTEAGEKESTCNQCGEVKKEVLEALGHDFSETYTVDEEATCQKEGKESKHCSRCEEVTGERVIEKLEHESDEGKVTKEATCTQAGITTYSCTVCGEVLKTEEIKALGHQWGAWVTDREATMEQEGLEHRTCEKCEEKETHTIPKIGTWKGATKITGDLVYGSTVSAGAVVEGGLRDDVRLEYQWYRSKDKDASSGKEAIEGAVEETYTLGKEDIGNYVSVEISSVSYVGTLTGDSAGPVQKREISIAGAEAENKVYDGTTAVTITAVAFLNAVDKDEISYHAEAAFDSADAGEDKAVTVTVSLTGESGGLYTLVKNIVETTASIAKADPVYALPSGIAAVEGQTLKDIVLPEGFTFKDDPAVSVGNAGSHEFEVIFTPEDTKNYNIITGIKVTITVEKKPDDSGNTGDDDNPGESTGGNDNPGENTGGNNTSNSAGSANSGTTGTNTGSTGNNNASGTNNAGSADNSDSAQNVPSVTPGDNVTTETRPDGTKVETKTEMAEDGTVKETVTETSKDGSTVKETVTETQTDGTVSSAVTETKADGSRTEKKEVRTADDTTLIVEAETKPDGTYTANSVIRTGASGKSGAVEIAESLLRAAAEDDRIDSVVVEITETTVNSSEKKNKNTVVNVEIPSVEGVSIEKVVLTKDSIAAAKDSGKGLKVNVTNGTTGSRADGYVVTIPAKQLAKISDRVEELNITVAVEKVANVADTSKKDDITKLVTKSKGKKAKTCVVEVAENADVKAGMNLKVPVKEKAGNSDNVYVYKYDKKTGKLIEAANSRQKVAEDGTVSIAAAAGTDYVVSAKKLSGKNVETIKDGISVSVSKKTAKTGKKLSVKVSLPDTVSQKAKFGTETATVTYKSSNTKVASVSKNGKITTKKTGTAVITTAIKLSSGQKMTKKQKITVK